MNRPFRFSILLTALALGSGCGVPEHAQEEAAKQPQAGGSTVLHSRAPSLPQDLWQRQVQASQGTKDWLVYGGNFKAWRYSALDQINKQNVKDLAVAWMLPTGMHDGFEASPIVLDGTMYFSTPWNHVYAVNAKTGEIYWHYVHPLPKSLPLCCGAVNRGVAVGAGKVFLGTLNAHVVALDAEGGSVAWEIESANYKDGYSYTVAPVVVDDKVILGVSGSDFGVRAFIDAYNVQNGQRVWRWWVAPGPGEPGNETWEGDSWQHGGGSAWMPVTYHPQSNTIYAGCGNPTPDLDGSRRKGDNLYSECTVALHPDTGKLKWHFQMIPHDVWDLDNVTETVLDEITLDGKKHSVGMVASKNGYFYVLDAISGKCYYALQYVHKVTWGKVDPDGTPHPDLNMAPVADRWTIVYPGASGGKEWCPVAYDPQRKRLFIPTIELPHRHKVIAQEYVAGLNLWGGASVPMPGEGYGHLVAMDVEKRKVAWDVRTTYPLVCGVLSTAGGLVITGTADQKLHVYDADNGQLLHEWLAPSGWHSAPVAYEVDGTEYIGFANGWGGWVMGFDATGAPELSALPKDNVMYAFALKQRIPSVPHPGPALTPKAHPQVPAKTHEQEKARQP